MATFTLRPDYTARGRERIATIVAVYESDEHIVEEHATSPVGPYACRLVVKRRDRAPIRSWRMLQDVKNAIVGEDAVAIEIYPREKEVIDRGNLYHLLVLRDPAILDFSLV